MPHTLVHLTPPPHSSSTNPAALARDIASTPDWLILPPWLWLPLQALRCAASLIFRAPEATAALVVRVTVVSTESPVIWLARASLTNWATGVSVTRSARSACHSAVRRARAPPMAFKAWRSRSGAVAWSRASSSTPVPPTTCSCHRRPPPSPSPHAFSPWRHRGLWCVLLCVVTCYVG